MRNKDRWGGGAPVKTDPDRGAGGRDGSATAGWDAIGSEEDEPGDNNKPPGQQRVKVREKKTWRQSGSLELDHLKKLFVPRGGGR